MGYLDQSNELAQGARVVGIGVAGTTYSFFGMPFDQVAAILTCIFLFIQIFIHLPKVGKTVKDFIRKLKGLTNEDSS